jgi:hypothetical protein
LFALPALATSIGPGDSDPDPGDSTALPDGDINGDGVIDGADYAELKKDLGFASGGSRVPGDLDGDGDVDIADIGRAAGWFTGNGGSSIMTWEHGDTDGDGDVDIADLGLIAGAFTGSGSPVGAPASVPEPLTMAMFGLGLLTAGRYVKRRIRMA